MKSYLFWNPVLFFAFFLLSHTVDAQIYNYFAGFEAGKSNTTGSYNSFVGQWAGVNSTTGSHNSFIGSTAGKFNTTGVANSFVVHRLVRKTLPVSAIALSVPLISSIKTLHYFMLKYFAMPVILIRILRQTLVFYFLLANIAVFPQKFSLYTSLSGISMSQFLEFTNKA